MREQRDGCEIVKSQKSGGGSLVGRMCVRNINDVRVIRATNMLL